MRSSIIRGMPYGTMQYAPGVIPAVSSEIMLASAPMIDSEFPLVCGTLDSNTTQIPTKNLGGNRLLVNKDVELHFAESDFTWLVFFSYPVYVECFVNPDSSTNAESISHPPGEVVEIQGPVNRNAFLLSVSMIQDALQYYTTTATQSASSSRVHEEGIWFAPQTSVLQQPGETKELLMYALPHHTDIIRPLTGISTNTVLNHCVQSLHGNACLVLGGKWVMGEGELKGSCGLSICFDYK
jgi:Glycosyl hydrolase family 81 N-terminal domain